MEPRTPTHRGKNSHTKRPQPQPPHRRGTSHRRLQPLYTEKYKISCSGFLPNSPLAFVITSLRRHFPSSPLPFVTTSLRYHFPSSPLPFVTTPSLLVPFIKVNSTVSLFFIIYCYIMYYYIIYHPSLFQVSEFYLSVIRNYYFLISFNKYLNKYQYISFITLKSL